MNPILLIEDEPGLVMTITDLLTADGHRVESVSDGDAGLTKATQEKFALIILDVMLPQKTGFEVCRQLRQAGIDKAILMLTAKTQVVDRVVGLKLGADDYLTKPFDPAELLARVEALLRRVNKENRVNVRSFQFGDVEIDFERAEVRKAGQPLALAAKRAPTTALSRKSSRPRRPARGNSAASLGIRQRSLFSHYRCTHGLASPKTR